MNANNLKNINMKLIQLLSGFKIIDIIYFSALKVNIFYTVKQLPPPVIPEYYFNEKPVTK